MRYVVLVLALTGVILAQGETCLDPIWVPPGNFSDCDRTTGAFVNDYDSLVLDIGLAPQFGPDVVYAFTPSISLPVNVSVVPIGTWDISVYVFTNCDSPAAIAGADEHGPGSPEAITDLPLSAGVTYYFVVDGKTAEDSGYYCFNIASTVSADENELANDKVLLKVTPTLLKSTAEIEFSLAKADNVCIVIYNAAGQPVRTFNLGHLTAGIHKISWNGLDDSGSPLTPGVYFVKLNAGSASGSAKLTILR